MSSWVEEPRKSNLLKRPANRRLRYTIGMLAALTGLVFGVLSLFVVPAPSASTAVEVSGTLVSLSRPHPEYGDMGIVLDGGRSYYVNQANEVEYLAWEQMLSEVQPGDQVYLTVVTPLAWRLRGDKGAKRLPVAGIRTANAVYMDPAVSADRWTAQATITNLAGVSLLTLVLCMLPELVRLFKPRPPAKAVGA